MKLKTKKIIAREGLIILSILCISGLFIFIGNYFSKTRTVKWDSIPTWENTTPIKKGFDIKTARPINNLSVAEQKELDLLEHERTQTELSGQLVPPEDMPDLDNKSLIKRKLLSRLTDIGFVFLLLGYPSYWLSRFIFWAFRTLKQKEANG